MLRRVQRAHARYIMVCKTPEEKEMWVKGFQDEADKTAANVQVRVVCPASQIDSHGVLYFAVSNPVLLL